MGSVFSSLETIARRLGVSTNVVALETIEAGEWDLQDEIAATMFTLEKARMSFGSEEHASYLYLHARHYKRVRKMLYLGGQQESGVVFGEAEKLKRKSLFTTLRGRIDFQRAMIKYAKHVGNKRTFEGPQVRGQPNSEEKESESTQ